MLLKNNQRHHSLLKKIANDSNWDKNIESGYGKGVAINEFMVKNTSKGRDNFGEATSIVAMIAEIEISKKGRLVIKKIDCKIDCGICINPNQVISQAEGGIMMGISMLLNEEITFENGMVVQSNYDDYKIAKMKNTPEMNISIVKSSLPPAGIAEAVVAPVMPAITNAIFAATGKRIRKLPIGKQKLV
jgi:CO/xanthine dehydrogenase Mo-binding subunit